MEVKFVEYVILISILLPQFFATTRCLTSFNQDVMVLYIGDPHSISLDKLHAAFDYILSVSNELFQDQSRQ